MTERRFACRGIFFDLYGTLLRYGAMDQAWQDWLHGMRDGLAAAGHHVDAEALEATFAGFLNSPEPPTTTLGRTLFERRVSRELATLGVTLTASQLAALCDHCVGRWQDHVTLDPEALALLAELRRSHTLALVSNFDHEIHVHTVLRDTGLAEHFATIVVSAEVGVAKPHPGIFDAALRSTGLAPADVVYVGDADVDRDASLGAGMRFVRIARNAAPSISETGVMHIRALSELPSVVSRTVR